MKRLATIITATVVVAVLTGIYTFKMPPVYRATATVEVETTTPNSKPSRGVSPIPPVMIPRF